MSFAAGFLIALAVAWTLFYLWTCTLMKRFMGVRSRRTERTEKEGDA